MEKGKELNKEQERRSIIADNISKRLKAVLSDCELKYICRGKLKPYIYTRKSGMFYVSTSNKWNFDANEVICNNGMNNENKYECITVMFQNYDNFTQNGLFRLVPENIYFKDYDIVEKFFQDIKRFIKLNSQEKMEI